MGGPERGQPPHLVRTEQLLEREELLREEHGRAGRQGARQDPGVGGRDDRRRIIRQRAELPVLCRGAMRAPCFSPCGGLTMRQPVCAFEVAGDAMRATG